MAGLSSLTGTSNLFRMKTLRQTLEMVSAGLFFFFFFVKNADYPGGRSLGVL